MMRKSDRQQSKERFDDLTKTQEVTLASEMKQAQAAEKQPKR
ncbi:hypothetical protein ACFQPF_18375 [Fictibacillus iocasae]|uniref:YfhE family protein n=1 Tax=Fictibacillus iocasae TaxID=2715437 RepID=A0ABW2P093_9BACL